MSWLRSFVHRLMGRDRYHDQAEQVNIRGLRVELLNKRLAVVERRTEGLDKRVTVIERRGSRR